ncbi:Single-stranded-DNA-specific exonuclease RecJ [bioreactor metagenome]|uniref:Single-stranded-DNA-specific exonuclease RecJ n=1 Tax=bioreactor metagenome TaxID=1076179 RepID=A0A644ZHN7_9ZZZZ
MVKQRTWVIKEQSRQDVADLCLTLGVSEIIARLLINRGLTTADLAKNFLNKSIDSLHDPMLMPDMDKAVARINKAIQNRERITIFGDYDVDGVTSTAILHRYLTGRGATVGYYIPSRTEEGYGVSLAAIEHIVGDGTSLIITVDSGITASEEIEYATKRGLDVVVTDHHECRPELPAACAVVNPKRPDSIYPFKELAGVGVVFKLICAMEGRENLQSCIDRFSELAAFGTIADVMPLTGENRVLVSLGIKRIEYTNDAGLRALIANSGVGQKRLTAGTIGYTLAPRVNAAGRLGCADMAVELFLTQDRNCAEAAAKDLCDTNRQRQEEENKILQEAQALLIADPDFAKRKVIILAQQGWHHGIIGIVASRLTDIYHLPCVMISFDDEGTGKGSCRSIAAFNIYDALGTCSSLLEKFGGHALAAGLSLRKENFDAFKEALWAIAGEQLTEEDLISKLSIDCEIPAADITPSTVHDVSYLEPYGMGNAAPVFLCRELIISEIIPMSGDKHLRLALMGGGQRLTCFMFGSSSADIPYSVGERIDICCTLDLSTYRGVQSVQVVIKDIREALSQQSTLDEGIACYAARLKNEVTDAAAPVKSDFVGVYKLLQSGFSGSLREMSRRLATVENGVMDPFRVAICLDVLEEMGIICREGDRITVNKIDGKINLNQSKILQSLKARS